MFESNLFCGFFSASCPLSATFAVHLPDQMAISRDPLFVPGVWGPYFSAMVPGFWLNEGGQSATGKLIDHLIQSHPAAETLKSVASKENRHQHDVLNGVLEAMAKERGVNVDVLTKVGFEGRRPS